MLTFWLPCDLEIVWTASASRFPCVSSGRVSLHPTRISAGVSQTQLINSQLMNFSCVEGTAASWFILWIGIDSLCFLFSASSSQLLDLRLSFSTVFCSPGTFLAAQVFAIAQPHTHLPKDYNSWMPVYILTTGRTGHPATTEIATSPTAQSQLSYRLLLLSLA